MYDMITILANENSEVFFVFFIIWIAVHIMGLLIWLMFQLNL